MQNISLFTKFSWLSSNQVLAEKDKKQIQESKKIDEEVP